MGIPTILFGVVVSSLFGAAFHLWKGGGLLRLLFYLVLGWVGFWLGHLIASLAGWNFLNIGSLHLGMAALTSAVFLLVGHWLSLVEIERK